MGCTQSRIEDEETVSRCKERKQQMKAAVAARNAFSAAHSAYAIALKNTGAALSDYAHGEVAADHDPLGPSPGAAVDVVQPRYETLLPPPPPPLNYPLHRASSMPEFSSRKPHADLPDAIIEEEEDNQLEQRKQEQEQDLENESDGLKHRRSSRRSRGSGGGGGDGDGDVSRNFNKGVAAPAEMNSEPPPGYDYFFSMENVPGPSLAEEVDDSSKVEREEIQRKMFDELSKKAAQAIDGGGDSKLRRSVEGEAAEMVDNSAEVPSQPPPASKALKKVKLVAPAASNKRANLLQIFTELDDCFLKASESAREVLKMLEANRLHYHSNFADNRGHIDHSARVMRVITWNRSFRGLSSADNASADFDSEENETLATVLDKMLAWEKKLYDEVKIGERMKLEYQRKAASLNKLKKRSASTDSIEKTKAAVSHLQTRYIVDMQSLDSTVSEINCLRDQQLYPKLVALVDGMATMWEAMHKHHEDQSKIVVSLRWLDISQSPRETSEHHHRQTVQLWLVAQDWNSQFEKLMTHQREYVKALIDWLKLNLIPMDTSLKENTSSPQQPPSPPIQGLLRAWRDHLEKLPDEPARTAICTFSAVMNTIVQHQADELKLRDKCEETRKELMRKTRHFEDWYHKYMERRTPPDEMDPERAQDKDLIEERRSAVETLKKKLEEEEEAYQKLCIQVREKSLACLKLRLPELFHAVSVFAQASASMYSHLRSFPR